MKKRVDVRSSQWYQIGVRFAEGTSRINDLPPTPNFYLGVMSVVVGNPKHCLWSMPDHAFWQKLGEMLASGAITVESLGCEQLDNPQLWEAILYANPDTKPLKFPCGMVTRRQRVGSVEITPYDVADAWE